MKQHKSFILFVILMIPLNSISGQNAYDRNGEKTGSWIVHYDNGNKKYEASFLNGKPVGLMKRYDEKGWLSAEMMFDTIGERCYVKLFRAQDDLAAEGWYADQEKDSVWTYFSAYDDHVIMREPYRMGKLNGTVYSYYPNGRVSGQTDWKDNRKEGSWLSFFENGEMRSEGHYLNGSKEGNYTTYYTNGKVELTGEYRNNMADGDWKYYNEDGELIFTYRYSDGKLLNESELLKGNDEVLKKIQEIPDPEEIIEE